MHGEHRRGLSTPRLLLVPALVTLALTQLRLTGDLLRLSAIGDSEIAWLVPIFGAYFALYLMKTDPGAPSAGRLFRATLLPIGLLLGGLIFLRPTSGGMALASLIAIVLIRRAWPRLGHLLLGYAVTARLPVILTMLVATLGGWDTGFDVAPYSVLAGLLPQLTIWIGFTVVIGGVVGAVAIAVRGWLSDETKPISGSTQTG